MHCVAALGNLYEQAIAIAEILYRRPSADFNALDGNGEAPIDIADRHAKCSGTHKDTRLRELLREKFIPVKKEHVSRAVANRTCGEPQMNRTNEEYAVLTCWDECAKWNVWDEKVGSRGYRKHKKKKKKGKSKLSQGTLSNA